MVQIMGCTEYPDTETMIGKVCSAYCTSWLLLVNGFSLEASSAWRRKLPATVVWKLAEKAFNGSICARGLCDLILATRVGGVREAARSKNRRGKYLFKA